MKINNLTLNKIIKNERFLEYSITTLIIMILTFAIIMFVIRKKKNKNKKEEQQQQQQQPSNTTDTDTDQLLNDKIQTPEEMMDKLEQNGFVKMKGYRPNQEQDVKLYNDELFSVKMFKRNHPQAKGFVCYADNKDEKVAYIGICDPDIIHEFMVDKEKYYERDVTVSYVARILGDSLLFNLLDVWKMKRKIYGQMFHFYQYHSLTSLARTITIQASENIQEIISQPIQLIYSFEYILGQWALNLFFGENANQPGLQTRLRTAYNNARSAILLLQPQNIQNCLQPLKDILLEFLHSTAQQIKQDPDYAQKPQNNITWYLLNSKDVSWDNEFLDQVCQDITIFFFAGRDTMAHTLQMMFYYISIYPEYKEHINQEIQNLKSNYSLQNISQMKYLEATIKETLRHYGPTTTILPKVAMERHTLINNKVNIEEGTIVSLAIQELNYDPKYYNEPEKFYPERWFDEELKQNEKKIFMPFSYGSHKCIGDKLALPIMKMVYITLSEIYDIKVDPKFQLKLLALIQYTPSTPIPFILKKKPTSNSS